VCSYLVLFVVVIFLCFELIEFLYVYVYVCMCVCWCFGLFFVVISLFDMN